MNKKKVIKTIAIIILYFALTSALSFFQLDRNSFIATKPTISYFATALLSIIIGYVLFKDTSSEKQDDGLAFCYVLGIGSLTLLILPFLKLSPSLTVYLFDIHIEIISGNVLGLCFTNLKK